ncbi:GNAT family N-acetyltransferase [Thermoleophilia bacterium SCSIO 60948]|nr:GNAT family N-acetyltransferase [Thermoleophilia bacterium SCSIO 60948]
MGAPGFEIRFATPADAGELVDAYEWLFAPPGEAPPGWDPERAREAIGRVVAATGSDIIIAEADGRIAGFCSVYLDIDSVRFGRRVWVEDLAVDPARRSGGIGAELLSRARAWARERGATHLELDSGLARPDAHRFYEREGAPRSSYVFGWRLGAADGV